MLKFLLPMMIMMFMKPHQIKISMTFLILSFNFSLQSPLIQKVSYIFMGDLLSFWNFNLTMWVVFIITFMKTTHNKFHIFMSMTLLWMFSLTFFTWNLMMFYAVFEMTMLAMLITMMIWSYQPERAEAMVYLIIMAVMFSLPFFVMILNNYKNLNFWFLKIKLTLWEYLSVLFIFMMKMPAYFMHFWLPKVHVEAPIQGSMVLAAIMLKLGCYGMMRMLNSLNQFKMPNTIIISMIMWSMVILSVSCFIQSDIKTLIAYSSVVHMMLVLIVMLINKTKSLTSSITIMMSHGLCAASLFFMSNIYYKNSKSRSILMNTGSATLSPPSKLMWFCACMTNAPMPPAISMAGELLCFKILTSWSSMYSMILIMAFTSSLYSIYMYYTMTHSKFTKLTSQLSYMSMKSNFIMIFHLAPIILITIKMKMLMII